jgi:hypothetical protein
MLVCLACYGDRVAALLETATRLRFYQQESTVPLRQIELPAPVQSIGLDALLGLLLAEEGSVLICGGLACCARDNLRRAGVRVVPWIGGAADEVALAWWSGRIQQFRMPGCGRKWRQCSRRNGQ